MVKKYFYYQSHKIYVTVVTLSARGNQKLSKLLSKGFEKSVYWNEYKAKNETITTTNEYRYFLELNFVGVNRLFVVVYLSRGNDVKWCKTGRLNFPKGITKNYNVIINGKNFQDQPIDSYIKCTKKLEN